MSDAIKVVRACAIGGAVTVLAAIAVAPVLNWWLVILAILAGFSGGYLSWEFREAVYAVPEVWRSFKKDFVRWSQPFVRRYNKTAEFLKDGPHPFFWEFIVVILLLLICSFYMSRDMAIKEGGGLFSFLVFTGAFFVFSVMFLFYSCVAGFIITAIGAKICGVTDWPVVPKEGEKSPKRKWKDVLLWQITGVILFIPYVLWQSVGFVTKFVKKYFILIHSRERLLCGFDGLLGGLGFAVWVWSNPAMPATQRVLMIGLGAMLGGMFGFISYQLISIKWLKLVPKS